MPLGLAICSDLIKVLSLYLYSSAQGMKMHGIYT